MTDVRWLDEREERAWRALQFMQMRLESELLFVDELAPEQLDPIAEAAEKVLAEMDNLRQTP